MLLDGLDLVLRQEGRNLFQDRGIAAIGLLFQRKQGQAGTAAGEVDFYDRATRSWIPFSSGDAQRDQQRNRDLVFVLHLRQGYIRPVDAGESAGINRPAEELLGFRLAGSGKSLSAGDLFG